MAQTSTLKQLIAKMEAHAATLPRPEDGVHVCWKCGSKEQRWHSDVTPTGHVREYIRCDACWREQTLRIGKAR